MSFSVCTDRSEFNSVLSEVKAEPAVAEEPVNVTVTIRVTPSSFSIRVVCPSPKSVVQQLPKAKSLKIETWKDGTEMQFGAQPPLSAVAGYPYPNGFPDPRRIYGIPGPPPPHPGQPNPYFPSWNSMPALGSPPGVLRPTVDGWYVPPNPPLLPNHLGSDSSYPYSPTLVSTPSITGKPPPMDTRVHDFWKGRFAPFPGTTSPPSLLGKTPSRVVTITAPHDTQTQSPAQRQPPHSSNVIFETSNKHATVQFTGKVGP